MPRATTTCGARVVVIELKCTRVLRACIYANNPAKGESVRVHLICIARASEKEREREKEGEGVGLFGFSACGGNFV